MGAQLSGNGGSHERAPAAVEALVLALHVVVTEAAHAHIHSIAAGAAALHMHEWSSLEAPTHHALLTQQLSSPL